MIFQLPFVPPSIKYAKQRGFTLIELVVAAGIIVVLVGGGIAAFTHFNEKQQVLSAARDLQQMMRIAQTKARAREVSKQAESLFGCDVENNPIVAYQVYAPAGAGSTVVTIPICDTSLVNYAQPTNHDVGISTLTLPSSVTLVEPIQLDFLVLYGGIRNYNSNWTYHLTGGSYGMEFTVSEGGEIGDVTETP